MSTDAQLALKICRYVDNMEKRSSGTRQLLYTILVDTLREKCRQKGFDIVLLNVFSSSSFTESMDSFRDRLLRYIGDYHQLRVLLDESL